MSSASFLSLTSSRLMPGKRVVAAWFLGGGGETTEPKLDNLERNMLASGLTNLGLACCGESGECAKVFLLGMVELIVLEDSWPKLSLWFTFTNGFERVELLPTLAVALASFDRSPCRESSVKRVLLLGRHKVLIGQTLYYFGSCSAYTCPFGISRTVSGSMRAPGALVLCSVNF